MWLGWCIACWIHQLGITGDGSIFGRHTVFRLHLCSRANLTAGFEHEGFHLGPGWQDGSEQAADTKDPEETKADGGRHGDGEERQVHAASIDLALPGQPRRGRVVPPRTANLVEQQIQLVQGMAQPRNLSLGNHGRICFLIAPVGFDLAEVLRKTPQPLLGVNALQGVKKHGHPDRRGPQGPPQISLGASRMTQPVFEEELEIVQLLGGEGGGEAGGDAGGEGGGEGGGEE